MSDDADGNREPTDDGPEHAMTDDTADNGFEQTIENDEPNEGNQEKGPEDEELSEDREATDEEAESSADGESARRIDDDLRRKLNYALLLGLGLLALIAVIQFYLNMSSVINQWVTREFRSLFQAVFNLVVLLVVGAAISRQVKRLAD